MMMNGSFFILVAVVSYIKGFIKISLYIIRICQVSPKVLFISIVPKVQPVPELNIIRE
jgi:hypothetical protein